MSDSAALRGPIALPDADQLRALPPVALKALLASTSSLGFVGKGSGGKSTLAVFLAVRAAQEGRSVLLLDADAQNRSGYDWLGLRLDMQGAAGRRMSRAIELVRVDVALLDPELTEVVPLTASRNSTCANYDLVIIDFAGSPTKERARWLSKVNKVLLPAETTAAAMLATQRIVGHCRDLGVEPTIVFNRTRPGLRLEDAAEFVREMGLERAPDVRQYVRHQDAFAQRVGITELPSGAEAASDVKALWAWCRNQLDRTPSDRQPLNHNDDSAGMHQEWR